MKTLKLIFPLSAYPDRQRGYAQRDFHNFYLSLFEAHNPFLRPPQETKPHFSSGEMGFFGFLKSMGAPHFEGMKIEDYEMTSSWIREHIGNVLK